jgi:hypothetical protein
MPIALYSLGMLRCTSTNRLAVPDEVGVAEQEPGIVLARVFPNADALLPASKGSDY